MVYFCPDCGAPLEGTMLDPNLWCPEEEREIPNSLLEEDNDPDA